MPTHITQNSVKANIRKHTQKENPRNCFEFHFNIIKWNISQCISYFMCHFITIFSLNVYVPNKKLIYINLTIIQVAKFVSKLTFIYKNLKWHTMLHFIWIDHKTKSCMEVLLTCMYEIKTQDNVFTSPNICLRYA